jgi:general secretion pathway protein G
MRTHYAPPSPRVGQAPSLFRRRIPRPQRPLAAGLARIPDGAAAAFTLIEIVLVITILAVLGAATIYLIKGNVDVAKETRVDTDIKNILTQIKVYEARNLQPPTNEQGLKALVELPTVEPVPERWTQLLEEMPKDPWGREYRYVYPAKRSKAAYDVFSVGQDGMESADDIGNWKPARKN